MRKRHFKKQFKKRWGPQIIRKGTNLKELDHVMTQVKDELIKRFCRKLDNEILYGGNNGNDSRC